VWKEAPAAQAVELYLHAARLIMRRAATWPEEPFPGESLAHAEQLYTVIRYRVDALGRPPSPDVLCATVAPGCTSPPRLSRMNKPGRTASSAYS